MIGPNLDTLYQIEKQLNASNLAVSYRARRLEHSSVAAVKLFRAQLPSDALRHFEAEVVAWNALRHPNITMIADRGVQADRPWIATRWLEGETLATRITRAPLQLTAAMMIFRPLMAALASAHAARLAHRNLKPNNVLLEQGPSQRRERVQLLDFTPAPALINNDAPPTQSPYLAPELIAGEMAGARSDVFAAGVLLIAMLTGPLQETRADAETAAEPSRAAPGLSGALLAWIRRATAQQASRRFADAGEMLGELIDAMPRDLRSGQTVRDGLRRSTAAASAPQSNAPASTEPTHARSTSQPDAGFGPTPASAGPSPLAPLTASVPAAAKATPAQELDIPIVVPPHPRLPIEARGLDEFDASRPSMTAPVLSPRDEGGNSLRPIESPVIARSIEPLSRLLMAVSVVGAIAIAGLTLFQEVKHRGRGRAQVSDLERLQPAATAKLAPEAHPLTTVELAPPQLPAAAASRTPAPLAAKPVPAASKAPAPASAVTLVAAPGRPPIRDPWSDPMPVELKRLHDAAQRGALADEAKVTALWEYNRDHHDDVRGNLVIGQLYFNRIWHSDCVEQWQTALQRDPGARGAPELLPGLLEIIAHGRAAPVAQALLLKVYGSEALAAIEDARDTARNAAAAMRFHNVWLKITESVRKE